MDVLKFSPNEIYILFNKMQEIKNHLYKTADPRERGNDQRAFQHYFPSNIIRTHGQYQGAQRVETPNNLVIEVSLHAEPRVLTLFGETQGYNVLIQEISQDGEYEPAICQLSPYLNPYLNELSVHVNELYDLLDISHDRKRKFLIEKFLN